MLGAERARITLQHDCRRAISQGDSAVGTTRNRIVIKGVGGGGGIAERDHIPSVEASDSELAGNLEQKIILALHVTDKRCIACTSLQGFQSRSCLDKIATVVAASQIVAIAAAKQRDCAASANDGVAARSASVEHAATGAAFDIVAAQATQYRACARSVGKVQGISRAVGQEGGTLDDGRDSGLSGDEIDMSGAGTQLDRAVATDIYSRGAVAQLNQVSAVGVYYVRAVTAYERVAAAAADQGDVVARSTPDEVVGCATIEEVGIAATGHRHSARGAEYVVTAVEGTAEHATAATGGYVVATRASLDGAGA